MTTTVNELLYGTPEAPPPLRRLTAGPLSALLDAGNLRTIRFGDGEVIRGIAFLVRSRSWGTLAPQIDGLHVEETATSFAVSYTARVADGAQRLGYVARIEGHADGRLLFRAEATAETAFETCRTGFVVLHPIAGVAGAPVRVEHVDGRLVESTFPRLIDPVQPMRDLRALTHAPAPGLTVTCRMDGDTFEMEDQRNWSDASFKTYSRPLALPWPFTLAAGERVSQQVTVTCAGTPPRPAGPADGIPVAVGTGLGAMPPLSLGCTPEEAAAALPHVATLRQAGIASLVCRYDPRLGHGAPALAQYRTLAEQIGAAVELQIVVPSLEGYAADLRAAAAAAAEAGLVPLSIMVVPAADLVSTPPGSPWPPSPKLEAVYWEARAAFPGVRLGGGMFTHFTELNRKRPPLDLLDFITFATTAIVHAADDRSVMETIESLPDIAASAQAIAGALPFVVGPSAIGMRDNPNGPGPLPNPQGLRLPLAGRDLRQRGLFNAAWTLGCIAGFAQGGAARIALAAPAGDFGILDAAGVWPVFHVLRACAALRGGTVCALDTPQGLAGLLVRQDATAHLLLANLTPDPLRVVLPNEFHDAHLAMLDVAALQHGFAAPTAFDPSDARAAPHLTLDAYAVARLRAA